MMMMMMSHFLASSSHSLLASALVPVLLSLQTLSFGTTTSLLVPRILLLSVLCCSSFCMACTESLAAINLVTCELPVKFA